MVHASLRLREAQKLGFKSACTGKLGAGDSGNGLAVGEYSSARERFPGLPEFRVGQDILKPPIQAVGGIIALYVITRVLL